MTDAVLDLSAKSTSDQALARLSPPNDTPPSPQTPIRRASSFENDESDSSSLPGSAIKPVAGPIPRGLRDSPSSSSETPHDRGDLSPTPPSAGLGTRPFMSYPTDSMSSLLTSSTSPLLAGHTTTMPPGLPMGIGLSSLYDSPSGFPPFPITPLTSHLLQRKRRAESRSNTSVESGDETDPKKLKHVPEEKKDNSYWERRRKNNEAAKRSRDSRRQKEEEIAMRAAFLEQENLKLRAQVAILKNETAKLHYMLYNRL